MRENIRVKIRIAIAGFIFALLALAMCIIVNSAANNVYAAETDSHLQTASEQAQEAALSEMSEEQCLDFIVEKGVAIPQEYANMPDLGGYVKWVIETVEANPQYEFAYSYSVLHDFTEDIRNTVTSELSQVTAQGYASAAAAYTLQDSTQYGAWNDNFSKYNCYIYALGRTDIRADPGYFSNNLNWNVGNTSIYEIAKLVESDLLVLGKGGVYITDTMPEVISQGETLIAVRKTTNTGFLVQNDYHFMKYHPDGGFWTHKPGTTAILKYKYQPDDKPWTNEYINRFGIASPGNIVYDSEIYYIIYDWNGLIIEGTTVTDFIPQSGFDGEVVIPDSVTKIGNSAFADQTQLTQITIPASITEIGDEAFKGCSNLTELTFEDDSNLYSIGVSAFYDCVRLEEVTIPASVVFIRSSAFAYCTGMETLTFEEGSNLRYAFGLEDNAFAYCHSLSEINYNVRDLLSFNSTSNIFYNAGISTEGILLNIGAEVEWIPDYLFSGARISSISFAQPSNVTEIGDYAFTNYTGNQITIPQSVNWVFENSFPAGTTVTWEGKYVYNGSTLLQYLGSDTAFTVPQTIAEKAITAIGANAFAGETGLRECIIPATIEEIGENAFSGCTDLIILAEAAAKPAGWSDAFNPENVPVVWDWDSLNYTPINGGSEYAVTKGSGSAPIVFIPSYHNEKPVTAIGEQGFAGMENLTAVVFQDGSNITDIGREAFDGCALLSDIVLPGGVTYIGADAFSGCHSLAYIEIPQGAANIKLNGFSPETTVEWQGRFLFRGDTLLQYSGDEAVFIVPEGIAVIGANAFAGNTALEKCIVPVTVTDMEQDALKGCTGTIVAEAAAKPAGWDEGYNPDNAVIVWNLPEAAAGLTYTEINGGTEYAVSKGAQNAEMVYIPAYYNGKPVTQIGNLGFAYMTSIIAVVFEEDSNITVIGQQAFHGCENLADIVLPESVLSIGDSAFIECKSLTDIVLPGGLTEIGVNVFLDCIALKSAAIPDGVTEIGAHAFHGCGSLERIDLPDTVEQIGDYAFLGCHSLERINISENSELETIGVSAFLDCVSLTKVVLPNGAASIGQQAFHGCTNLTSIYIPESVETIGWYAFVGCGKVTVYTPHAAWPAGWDAAFNPSGGSVAWNSPRWYPSGDEGAEII